jgi:transcriptional regulator with XRE-family HTH domain
MEPIELKEYRARIGKAIRKLRGEENISARFLAKILGVAQPTISRIENGTTSISAGQLCFLAKSFNRPLSFFVGEQSPITYSNEDILNAGLVFYGAAHLKSKRSINIKDFYRTYSDFLNDALKAGNDTRFIIALGSTIFVQALNNNLNPLHIISTVTNARLQIRLYRIAEITSNACLFVRSVSPLKVKQARARIRTLVSELFKEIKDGDLASEEFSKIEIAPAYIAQFIDESLG